MFYRMIRKKYLILFVCITLTSGFFYAIPISLTQQIVDELSAGNSVSVFVCCTLLYMICRSLGCLFDYLGAILSKRLSNGLLIDLRRSFLESLYRKAPSEVYRQQFERMYTLFTSDIDTVANGFCGPILWFASSVSLFLWSSTTLAYIRLELAVIYVVAALLIMLNTIASGKRIKKNQIEIKKTEERRTSHAKLLIDQYMKLLVMNQDTAMIRINSEIDKESADLSFRDTRIASLKTLLNDHLYYLSGALVWLIGGFLVLQSEMTVGEITSFISFAGLIISPIVRFSSQWIALQKMRVSMQRLSEFYTDSEEIWGQQSADGLSGGLCFENISFAYSEEKSVITGFSGNLQAGNIYCISGANGSGKSTLFRLLMRIHEEYSGSIFYAGQDIRTFTKESLYGLIGYENEVPVIIRATLSENLTFGIQHADPTEIAYYYHASGLAQMLDVPLSFVVENGEKQFSRGQTQLIGIIRMLLSKKKILIFDETFSGIATNISAQIMTLLKAYCEANEAIVVFVSHNKDQQNMAECILPIDGKL